MRNIAICTPEISYNDAVSNDVFGMYDTLEDMNFNVSIFAEVILTDPNKVKHINKLEDFIRTSSDLMIYHLSTGWFKGFDILKNIKCKKIIKYHNITPPYFFNNFSSDHFENSKGGINQLKKIAGMEMDLYLCDSIYNMEEMISLGGDPSRCCVVPPFNKVEDFRRISPDFNILKKFNGNNTNLLSVGRVSPNKGFERLIEIFFFYHNRYNPESRLIIVGNKQPVLSAYIDYLYDKIERFKLQESVFLPGKVSNEQLKTYYLVSDIFTMTSYHEGFCVPLIEAMYLKIPIIAYSSTAVPDTVGNAGVLLDKLDQKLFSEALNRIIKDKDKQYELGIKGWERYQGTYKKSIIEEKFIKTIKEFL
jgi:glycosyltransferase involved in cell wall biosynthesis